LSVNGGATAAAAKRWGVLGLCCSNLTSVRRILLCHGRVNYSYAQPAARIFVVRAAIDRGKEGPAAI
jgi:hypothetical protein